MIEVKTYPCHGCGMLLPAADKPPQCRDHSDGKDIPLSYADTGTSCSECGGMIIQPLAPFCSCIPKQFRLPEDETSFDCPDRSAPLVFWAMLGGIVVLLTIAGASEWMRAGILLFGISGRGIIRRFSTVGFHFDHDRITVKNGFFRTERYFWSDVWTLRETMSGLELVFQSGTDVILESACLSDVNRWIIREKLFPLARTKGVATERR